MPLQKYYSTHRCLVCGGSHCKGMRRSREVSPKIIEVNFFIGFGLNFVESFLMKVS
jgi:hypothetical protein